MQNDTICFPCQFALPCGKKSWHAMPRMPFLSVFYLPYPIKKRVLWTDFGIEFKNSAVLKATLVLSCLLWEENKPTAPHRASQCLREIQGWGTRTEAGTQDSGQKEMRELCFEGDSHKDKWIYSFLALFLLLLWTPLKGSRGQASLCLCAAAFQDL